MRLVKKIAFALILVCPPFLKPLLLRWLCGAKIGRKVRIGWFSSVMGRRVEIGDYTAVRAFSVILLDGEVKLDPYVRVSNFSLIYGSGSLTVGRHSYIGAQVIINVWEDVRIGSVSGVGPRSMILTHGSFFPYTEGYWMRFAGVTIGDRSWIGSGTFIHPGVRVGDDTFVNSMSVVKGDVPAGAVYEGFPAQRVGDVEKLKRKMTPRRVDLASEGMLRHFAEVALRRERGIEPESPSPFQLRFRSRLRNYLVAYVPSEGPDLTKQDAAGASRVILIVNRPGWTAPAALRKAPVIDLGTMRTSRSRDRIFQALWHFLYDYYGLKLEYQD